MKTIVFVAATLAALTTNALAQSPALQRVDDRLVACLIGNAGVSLHKQIGTQVNTKAATDAAMTYAEGCCVTLPFRSDNTTENSNEEITDDRGITCARDARAGGSAARGLSSSLVRNPQGQGQCTHSRLPILFCF